MAARFEDHPDAVAETARARRDADASTSRSDLGYRYPGAEDATGRSRRSRELCQRALRRPLPARRTGCASEARGAAGGGARADRRARAVGLLPAAPRHARARARGRGRGARPGHRARAAAAGPRARLLGLLDRLLPHRPLARRPGRQRALPRALPQRGDHRAAGHRPRLPARRARGADPARPRALRPRALGARRRLPDLPRARRDPRARQGARAAAGGDRARRARGSEGCRRAPRSTATSTIGARAEAARRTPAARPLAPARRARPTRPTACRATSPSTRAG